MTYCTTVALKVESFSPRLMLVVSIRLRCYQNTANRNLLPEAIELGRSAFLAVAGIRQKRLLAVAGIQAEAPFSL